MKTALKITLRQESGHIQAEAGVGIFGQQAIPTIISMLFFWPVLVTQIWGMIKQSSLDDHAMELIEKSLQHLIGNPTTAIQVDRGSFCPDCGGKTGGGKFCPKCGTKLD